MIVWEPQKEYNNLVKVKVELRLEGNKYNL